jgi:DNA invertase Pin-like site-specific DNA recombinase
LVVDSQREAILSRLKGLQAELVAEFTEFERRRHNGRPALEKALAACKKLKAKLAVARLDRLSRNLAFLTLLKNSGVEFIAVDNPHANKSTMHNLVAAARCEHDIVSERAAAALKVAKARGKRLGNPKLSEARRRAIVVNMDRADCYLETVLPVIQEIQESGVKSLRGIARTLAARGITTARGGEWTAVQVSAIVRRANDWSGAIIRRFRA